MIKNKNAFEAIIEIQKEDPELLLCGSAALIIRDVMDDRDLGDIDFVVNEKYLDSITSVTNLDLDRYPNQESDRYQSYHGTYYVGGENWPINVLVFDNDVALNKEHVIYYNFVKITTQDIDTILYYKKKYNRKKDIKDLEKIANKCVEELLAE